MRKHRLRPTGQPFDFLDSNEEGTFWTQTNTNSIAVGLLTDSKVVANKVRMFISSSDAKIRCAIYKCVATDEEDKLTLVTQSQLFESSISYFVDIPFENVVTLDSDTLYYFAFECSSSESIFLGKTINTHLGLLIRMVHYGDAFNSNTYDFKTIYPNSIFVGNVFIPYFKII